MKTLVYGRTAYEGFAKAIGSKLGLSVTVEDGSHACIDAGGVVHLPQMSTYQTEPEFAVTCGTIVHELAHRFYQSHRLLQTKRSRLEHDCLNAVLDVADETWVAEWFDRIGNKRAGELLTLKNNHWCYSSPFPYYDWYYDWSKPETHAWKVLCTGIFKARLSPSRQLSRMTRYNAREAAKLGVNAKLCWTLIKRARRTRREDATPNARRFRKLLRLTAKLATLLKPFTPPDDAPPAASPLEAALGAGSDKQPKNAEEATAQDGADLADKSRRGSGGTGDDSGSPNRYDPEAFALLSPAVHKVTQRIALDGDGATVEDGLRNGPALGQAYRLMTDGQCLARWGVSDHADGVSVSVILDCSGSMHMVRSKCAGIARAFALSMRECGAVQSLVFGSLCKESDDFDHVRAMGNTATHLALDKAIGWLSGRQVSTAANGGATLAA